ncbi:PAAR domain-containing protein [Epibacterium sp. Ofav1-8]|uniref:PAAR domain-containing protein n=1 Tax=Epibacterium sp. Ofav1-8 TaxID=2917735 RepID=UPI001EF4458B|nr:PAAR domain-containing protein [Epibacterium sp. Ofav1-8]MCG7622490.1 PAAR domain-containing protein [Epibacterium sp. Ofav1-8]
MGGGVIPAAGRLGDTGSEHDGFPQTPAIEGSDNVGISGKPALREGDAFASHSKPKHPPHGRALAVGSGGVFINGKPAGRVGDAIDCCGAVESGSADVSIGG